MIVLIDANIILDVGLKRAPWYADAIEALRRCKARHVPLITWHTLQTVYYVMLRNKVSEADTRQFCRDLVAWVNVATTHHQDALDAFALPMANFEDALQATTARSNKADMILTRNPSDFADSPILAVTLEDFLKIPIS